jgi:hypothetical protein
VTYGGESDIAIWALDNLKEVAQEYLNLANQWQCQPLQANVCAGTRQGNDANHRGSRL